MLSTIILSSCTALSRLDSSKSSFGEDVAFLRKHSEVIVLTDPTNLSKVAVSPPLQGRVVTSTLQGDSGPSFGWINRDAIQSGKNDPHMNAFGGEDRFWLGPEGGQYSIFFKEGAPFELAHWFTPVPVNEEAFQVTEVEPSRVVLEKDMKLTNYSGTEFALNLNRKIELLTQKEVGDLLGITPPPAVELVAYRSENTITNTGKEAWKRESGLLSIWIVGMFQASDSTTVVIPYVKGNESELGPVVNDMYFGKVPTERLAVEDEVLYFRGDANYRSKIGLLPSRAKPILGSYDPESGVLTLTHYTKPPGATEYVNSMWEIQEDPYSGDAINSYNDGPPPTGKEQMGAFYELETSSPAAALAPKESLTHIHTTMHFRGPEGELGKLAKTALGVTLDEIKSALQ